MQVAKFLSHQPPMLLVDELVEAGEDYAIAKLRVTRELLFSTDLGLPTWTTIEIMAQTISLYSGVNWHQKGQPPRLGFLLGTKRMAFNTAHFPLNSEITIRVKKKYRHKHVWFFDCELKCEDQVISSTLNVYEPVDE